MASTSLILLQLVLASLASASHHMGGVSSVRYGGTTPEGQHIVVFYDRDTYDRCSYSHFWTCYQGQCGTTIREQSVIIDNSTNAPSNENLWCETEVRQIRIVPSDKPFLLRAASCCWISVRNLVNYWRLLTHVDLGRRSDTNEPNRSPNIAIVPVLRVPQNCPRTYKLAAFDPDGDRVRCRYGSMLNVECSGCSLPAGFRLDQDFCKLHYLHANADYRSYAFEMVVEDFPQRPITLTYSDGSKTFKASPPFRAKRAVGGYVKSYNPYATTTHYYTTASPTTTYYHHYPYYYKTPSPTTTYYHHYPYYYTTPSPTATPYHYYHPTTTTASVTTTAPPATTFYHYYYPYYYATPAPTTKLYYYHHPATTTASTTTPPTTTSGHYYYHYYTTPYYYHTTTTSTPAPTTTTSPPSPTYPPYYFYTTTSTTPSAPPGTPQTTPLSRLPLHFSFIVDSPAPSCAPGLYIPKYVGPTPNDGTMIHAEVDKEVQIRVRATSTVSTIENIVFSGPQKTRKSKTTHNEFVISWTPVSDDLGHYFVICFAVESKWGSSVYQSEMRCVIVGVGAKTVKANVTCGQSEMTVKIEKSSFPRLSEDHLRLSDPSNVVCSLTTHSNSTHVIGIVPLNACGTQIEEDDEYLKFKNEITTFDDQADVITRKHLLEVQFYCQYPKRGNVTQSFLAHRKIITVWEKGLGEFTYQFEFFPNAQFQTMINPNSYPLTYELGSRIFMQIEATSSLNNTELFVESCRATPYDNPNYKPVYSIIENGCLVDQTTQIHSPNHQNHFQFSVEAFKFIGLHDQVYISCSVIMCQAGEPNTRCAQGCIQKPSIRRKRAAITQSSTHLISQGPLRLGRSADRPLVNLNLNLVFIAGCLLAAVGLISGVAVYKARVKMVKYQPLPVIES